MEIPADIRDAIVQHAQEEAPNECCGVLAGAGGMVLESYPITNTENSPYRYSMDMDELDCVRKEIDDNGWEMLVIYHSHVKSPAVLSNLDIQLAKNWPKPYYLVISLAEENEPVTRLFSIRYWRGDSRFQRILKCLYGYSILRRPAAEVEEIPITIT